MVTAGLDMGSKFIKILLLRDGEVIGRAIEHAGFDPDEAAKRALDTALGEAGIAESDIGNIVATGAGRRSAPNASDTVTEVTAAAKGTLHMLPKTRTVIDVGAEEGRAVRCTETGKVADFAVNEKCAAGAGAFTETIARALEVPLEKFGQLSLDSDASIPMNAQCAVFAESEVVSLVHAKTPKTDIARAVHDAIASRIVSMVRRVGVNEKVTLVGGVSNNPGFVDAMQRGLDIEIHVPEKPDYIGALGAALIAGERMNS